MKRSKYVVTLFRVGETGPGIVRKITVAGDFAACRIAADMLRNQRAVFRASPNPVNAWAVDCVDDPAKSRRVAVGTTTGAMHQFATAQTGESSAEGAAGLAPNRKISRPALPRIPWQLDRRAGEQA